ncbi:MAG: hypothetical protein FJX67_00170 [Alphaproteobacteria bacterium]|nr:hypothetical protein [Alphaproteobacteria bacterium]
MSSSEAASGAPGDLLADAGEEGALLRAAAAKLAALPPGAELPPELIQEFMTALVRLYTVRFQLGERVAPFDLSRPIPATAVMIMATVMLRAVNLELFELGMFQAWSGV